MHGQDQKIAALAQLAQLMVQNKDPNMLCRALTHSVALVSEGVQLLGVQLLGIQDQGSFQERGYFGTRGVLAPEHEASTGSGLIADSFRSKSLVTAVTPEGQSIAVIPFGVSYPVGCLVLTYSDRGEVPQLGEHDSELIAGLGSLYLSEPKTFETARNNALPILSKRQLEVLEFLAQGLTNQEIADNTGTSLSNIRQTTVTVYSKLGVRDRASAVTKAKQAGLLAVNQPS